MEQSERKAVDQMEETAVDKVEPRANWRERAILFGIMAIILLLDQVSKQIVINNLPLYTWWAPIPELANLFRFTHTTNTGAAFGLFQNGNSVFTVLAVIVAIGIIYYNHTLSAGHTWLRVALGLMLGGALGNLIDRVRLGYVTDFLDFGPWPVFNLADTSIVAGVALLAWLTLREERRLARLKDEAEAAAGRQEIDSKQLDESSAS